MEKVRLEQTHALLEKLAEYVMTKLPTRQEVDDKLALKADKADVERLDNKINMILEGMDAQIQQLDIIRIDMKAIGGTLDMHERRLGNLEERTFGYRVRDKDDKYE